MLPLFRCSPTLGLPRAVDAPELTTLGRTIGTPAYMSPEQCAGKRLLDGRADIYSLGTVLYRCLVGRAPFVGATTQILHAHVYESLTIPDVVWRSLPPSILAILQKTLQKEPDDRYADAGALADDLALMIQDATPANATVTMPSLPVTGSPADAMTQVLVPGLSEKTKDRPVIPWIPAAAPITPPTRTSSVTSLARRPRRPTNWAAVLLGILLTTGLVIMGFVALTAVIPRLGLSVLLPGAATSIVLTPESTSDVTIPVGNAPPPTGSAAAFANANSSETAVDANADTGIITPTVTNLAVLPSPNAPVPTAMTSETTPTTVIVVIPATPTVDPQLKPITTTLPVSDDLDVAATWQDVQHYYQSGEWGQARWSLMTMLSAKDGIPGLASSNRYPVTQAQQINDRLLGVPNAVYWGKWIDTFTVEEVGQILADIYISLAHEELINAPNLSDLPTQTTDYLIAAATVHSSGTLVRQLSAITTRLSRRRRRTEDYLHWRFGRCLYRVRRRPRSCCYLCGVQRTG